MASSSCNTDTLEPGSTEDRLLSRIMGEDADFASKSRIHAFYVKRYPERDIRIARFRSMLIGRRKRGTSPFAMLCHEAGAALVGAA